MFNVIKDPAFDATFDPTDPRHQNPLEPIMVESSMALAFQIDQFVRAAIRKAVDDSVLQLFVEAKTKLPGLDLELRLLTQFKRRITVTFQGHRLGWATFETKKWEYQGAVSFIHEVSEVFI